VEEVELEVSHLEAELEVSHLEAELEVELEDKVLPSRDKFKLMLRYNR